MSEQHKQIKEFGDLKGEVIKAIGNFINEEIHIELENGRRFKLYHEQDCCESVYVESIVGDLNDLIGSELLVAEESSYSEEDDERDDSRTWTFYKLATIKGHVDIRWIGSSNGYYSERVDFVEI